MKKTITLVAALLLATVSFAQLPVKFIVSEDISYDDNIYLVDNNTTDSFISTTRVGAEYKSQIPGSSLVLKAAAMGGYNAYTEDSSTNNYWDAMALVDVKNDMFNFGDKFIYTSDPANSSLTERAKRINNLAYFSFKTTAEKMFGVGVIVKDSYDRYEKSAWNYLNRNRIDAGAQLYYNMSPKTSFFAEYVYSNISYDDNSLNDSDGSTFALGVNGSIAPKVTGTAKATYAMRDYDKSIVGTKSNQDLFGYFVALEWTPTSQSKIGISGERAMQETSYATNRYFADSTISLYGSQKIYDKVTASLTLSYENMKYKYADTTGKKRDDNMYTIRPQVDYQFKDWLSAGVWYQFRTRQSNTPYDYDSNKVGLLAKAMF